MTTEIHIINCKRSLSIKNVSAYILITSGAFKKAVIKAQQFLKLLHSILLNQHQNE